MASMNCTEFETALAAAVEDRHGELDALREHAARCESCHALWEQFAILEQAIPAWNARVPQSQLADAVLARVDSGRPTPAPAPRFTPASAEVQPVAAHTGTASRRRRIAAVATVVATACTLAIVLRPTATPVVVQPPAEIATAPTDSATSAPAPEERAPVEAQIPVIERLPTQVASNNAIELDDVTPPMGPGVPPAQSAAELAKLVREATSAYMSLAEGAADAVGKAPILLPRTDLVAVESDEENSDVRADSWIDHWGEQLEPIGTDVGNAIDFLLDAVPLDPTTI